MADTRGDYKVMVKVRAKEDWDEFSGIFFKQELDSVVEHVEHHFDTEQFRKYKFGVFVKVREHDYRAKESAVWDLKKVITFK